MVLDLEPITLAHDKIKNLYDRVLEAQTNLANAIANMEEWAHLPLYTRRLHLPENLLAVDEIPERNTKRYQEVLNSYRQLEGVLKDNYRLYFNLPPEEEEPVGEEEEEEVEPPPPPPPPPSPPKKRGREGAKKKVVKTPSQIEAELEAERLEQERLAEEVRELERREIFKPYVEYVDNIISNKLIEAVSTSLAHLREEMAEEPENYPLFEILLELHEQSLVYVPSILSDDPEGFHCFIEKLFNNMYRMGEIMGRLNQERGEENYYLDVTEDDDVKCTSQRIISKVIFAMDEAQSYLKQFEEFEYLWLDNRQVFLAQFLKYGRLLTAEELEYLSDETGPGIKETPPTISQFKEQIDLYENVYKKVETLETYNIISYWLRVDVKPLRQAILNTVCKWGNMFKQHLVDRVTNSINELEEFIDDAIKGMQAAATLTEDDYEGLLKVMGYLMRVKDRQQATDDMFDPLKDIMKLLKEYGVEFSEETYVRLQELPEKWTSCKKVMVFFTYRSVS